MRLYCRNANTHAKMKTLRIYFATILIILCSGLQAQSFDKGRYYAAANGKKGAALKTALAGIIYRSTAAISYDGLLEAYKKTDVRADGKLWDMYSNVTNYSLGSGYAATYKEEGDGYNREHTIPQSIFSSAAPMKSDIYHVYPTDSKINGVRSNYCHGEVGTVKTASKNNFSLLGAPNNELRNSGCNEGYVFEPNDIYKGDFARTYFYFVTCYETRLKSFDGYGMFDKSSYPSLKSWAKEMLLRWSEEDAVSEKETRRIEAAYELQHNRNPFIDFPGLEQYIWGDYQEIAFSSTDYVNPYENPIGEGGDTGDDTGDDDDSDDDDNPSTGEDDAPTTEGTYAYTYYFNDKNWAATNQDGEQANWQCSVPGNLFMDNQGIQVTAKVSGATGLSPITFAEVETVTVKYTTNASKGAGKINVTVGEIPLQTEGAVTTDGGAKPRDLVFTSTRGLLTGKVKISVDCTTNSIYINSVTIKGGSEKGEEDALGDMMAGHTLGTPIIYDLSGRRVMHTENLTPGIYIINGRKIVVR